MEALLLLLDALVLMLATYMGFRDERKAKGAAQNSLFRTADTVEQTVVLTHQVRRRYTEGRMGG